MIIKNDLKTITEQRQKIISLEKDIDKIDDQNKNLLQDNNFLKESIKNKLEPEDNSKFLK